MSTHLPGEPLGWGRRRLLAVLTAVTSAGVILLAGLGFAIYTAVSTATTPAHGTPTRLGPLGRHTVGGTITGAARRDAIAAHPMLSLDQGAAQPGPPAAVPGASITIPPSTTMGPAGVRAGFAHTPAGAVGQLAAIEQVVLQSMSIPTTNGVHAVWAVPAAPGVAAWPLTGDVQAFLGAAQMGASLDPTSTVVATPAAAQVKGADGPDWVLACVLMSVRATIAADARMGYGYCERMQWHAGRWMIAPGATPAPAPSTWPGTELSIQAGWRTWAGTGN